LDTLDLGVDLWKLGSEAATGEDVTTQRLVSRWECEFPEFGFASLCDGQVTCRFSRLSQVAELIADVVKLGPA
jgi:hypothetical protein